MLVKFCFEQIMDEFDNNNFYYENEPDDELPMQQSIQGNALPLSESDIPMPEPDVPESQNNRMVEDEMPLILEQPSLDVEMHEAIPQFNESVDQPIEVNDDKENGNPIELLKAPMPPVPEL